MRNDKDKNQNEPEFTEAELLKQALCNAKKALEIKDGQDAE